MKEENIGIYENMSESSSETGESNIYRPDALENNLEVEEDAYLFLEYITIEWPAQSIVMLGSKLYLGTNPGDHCKKKTDLVRIDLKGFDYEDTRYEQHKIDVFVNRMKSNKSVIACVTDDLLGIIGKDELCVLKSVRDTFSYGLFVSESEIFVGRMDGTLCIYDFELKLKNSFKIHEKAVETICVWNNMIYTGSSDCTLKISDMNGNMIKMFENKTDINYIDVNNNGLVVCGDDNGKIHLFDKDFNKETIEWHVTPISVVKWKNNEIFVSGSDEQVCVWDVSLEKETGEEWDYHNYLLFVHQGQQYYKDIEFYDDKIITTSQDGLCVFTPISFKENKID